MNDPQFLRTASGKGIAVRRWIGLAILVVALIFAQLDRLVLSALIESIKWFNQSLVRDALPVGYEIQR